MASPSVAAVAEANTTGDNTAHTVNRSSGVAGRLTVAVVAFDGTPTLTWPTDYNEFGATSGAGIRVYAAWYEEVGGEGTTFALTSSASEKMSAIVYQISGAADPTTQPPEIAIAGLSSATTDPDPPSLAPTGGSKDYLFITGFIQDGEEADDDTWCNSAPTDYTNLLQKTSGTSGLPGTNCSLATAQRQLTATSDDPGTFNTDQSLAYGGFTIAVHPPAAAAEIDMRLGNIDLGF